MNQITDESYDLTDPMDEDAIDVLELLKAIDEDDGTRYTMDEVMAIISDTHQD